MTTYRAGDDPLERVMFPVREVDLFAEMEPGQFARVPRSKALVNGRSGHIVSIVGDRYQVLHNRTALQLAIRGCAATFPQTASAAWKVTRVHAPHTGGYCVMDLCYRPGDSPLVYEWKFAAGHTERYEPFFQVVNGYNGRIAFSLRFGVIRLVCKNGLIARRSVRLTSVAHDHKDMVDTIEKAIQAADFKGQANQIKAQLGRLWRVEIPHEKFAPVIHAVLGIRRPKRMDERVSSGWRELRRVVEEKCDRYVADLGSTAYALMAVVTDLATSPPTGRPFIYRARHGLQQRAGLWVRDFARKADRAGFRIGRIPPGAIRQWRVGMSAEQAHGPNSENRSDCSPAGIWRSFRTARDTSRASERIRSQSSPNRVRRTQHNPSPAPSMATTSRACIFRP